LKDNLQIIANAKESEDFATSVDDNGGVYFVPAFSGFLDFILFILFFKY
jgi:glycerol kinase